jgi:4-aminobutyrate aminotransferase-like enzyme
LACSVASRILQLIQEQSLDQNALKMGSRLQEGLHKLQLQFPDKIDEVRGMGLMLGIVLRNDGATDSAPSMALVKSLHQEGMLTIPSGTHVVRFLPALNIQPHEVDEALHLLEHTLSKH